jgi:hypothetical protein
MYSADSCLKGHCYHKIILTMGKCFVNDTLQARIMSIVLENLSDNQI